ncbi:MAG: glycoside hydrolase family 3 C-terminal domain-containing protein [Bacteroidales bacterium]|nr:glycoside hydrolase family 3 C-terminal domain-containing protein [Bacteroidales bacterium]
MKNFFLLVFSLVTFNLASAAPQVSPKFKPPVSYELANKRADTVLAKMSMEDKLQLISGYKDFFIKGFPQYGIPELYLSDATQGIKIRTKYSDRVKQSTAFPCPIALSATWNTALAQKYAASIGEECRATDIAVLLGPGMNIYRQSQCGRNFEYFGEDPFLSARIVENYVVGIQNTGTMSTLKHFVSNNTEFDRRRTNSVVDERALHEIYMPAFKAGIDAGAAAIMTAYNKVNGEWCGQSSFVIDQLLRKDLGFKGIVMTDWVSVWDAKKLIKSGMDLEMPGNKIIKENAQNLLKSGEVTEADINRMAKSIIRTCISMGIYDRPIKDEKYLTKYPDHEKVALQTAREAVVLLKNSNNILPLKADKAKKILLTGDYVETLARGFGSAAVAGYNLVTMLDAFQKEFGKRLIYAKTPTDEQIKSADVVLLSIGTTDTEGQDKHFALPKEKDKLVLKMAAKNPNIVVIVNSGSGIQMTKWNNKVAAILHCWYLGQNGNVALAEILSGKTNPSGKLPITIEKRFKDSPAFGYVSEKQDFNFREVQTIVKEKENDIYDINYKEGVFVGYRWYESKKIQPLFPFGFGLSYTTFELSDIQADKTSMNANDKITIKVKVKNTGKLSGAETVQLYISDNVSSLPRPVKELKGFQKVLLNAGKDQIISFTINKEDLSFYDSSKHKWVAEPGDFVAHIGTSSADIRGKVAFKLQ